MATRNKATLGTRINYTHPLARGMVRCYLANEGMGALIADSARGVHAALTGASTNAFWSTGQLGGPCLSFSGSSTIYGKANDGGSYAGDVVSVSGWFKTSTSAIANIATADDGSTRKWLVQTRTTGNTLRFTPFRVGSSVAIDSTTAVNDGKWHHFVGRWDGGTAEIWIDGTMEASSTFIGTMSPGTVPLWIGTNSAQTANFTGQIDALLVWNRVISPTEIKILGNRLNPTPFMAYNAIPYLSPTVAFLPAWAMGSSRLITGGINV